MQVALPNLWPFVLSHMVVRPAFLKKDPFFPFLSFLTSSKG